MVQFNFSNISGDANATRSITSTLTFTTTPFGSTTFTSTPITRTDGTLPINVTSTQTGVGLPGDTIAFTLTPSSDFYFLAFSDGSDAFAVAAQFEGPVTATLRFDLGSGITSLSDVTLNGGITDTDLFYLLPGGGSVPVTAAAFAGPVNGIKFALSTFSSFQLDSINGTPTCFAFGTHIATPSGEAAVQNLAVGDEILTAEGETRVVRWVGRQTFDTTLGIPLERRPVRISKGALGQGLPKRDLVVTGDHALFLDGILVNASTLVNHDTITIDGPDKLRRKFTVFHIETDDHALIQAEGVATETFVDAASRTDFDNYAQYRALYGCDRIIPEMRYPRVTAARLVPQALRRRLDASETEPARHATG